ncbi:unnamed protein product [Ectocarpus sp. CCAP 1310/34]|nr:unnamed protein product [Ectocarpus sp. CCAP 1310/34]
MEELRRVHSSDSVEKAIMAWNLLITSVTYMPILTQIIAVQVSNTSAAHLPLASKSHPKALGS